MKQSRNEADEGLTALVSSECLSFETFDRDCPIHVVSPDGRVLNHVRITVTYRSSSDQYGDAVQILEVRCERTSVAHRRMMGKLEGAGSLATCSACGVRHGAEELQLSPQSTGAVGVIWTYDVMWRKAIPNGGSEAFGGPTPVASGQSRWLGNILPGQRSSDSVPYQMPYDAHWVCITSSLVVVVFLTVRY